LQPGDVDALELDGFTTIQNTTPGLLQLNAPLVIELALDGVKIVNGSQSTSPQTERHRQSATLREPFKI
jgi:hypothetical protein